jgi:FHS family L-fucose permease-like MFS transporter
MAFQAETTHAGTDVKPFRKQYRLFHAAFAQFCYTGAQVAIAGAFINYVTETRFVNGKATTPDTASRFLAGAQGAFTLGRFGGSALMKFVRPRYVFFVFMTMCIIFIIPSITGRGNTGMSMLYIVLFFESIIFPTIVALGMRGLGKYSKRGSGLIVAGVSGGAVVPPLLFAASDSVSLLLINQFEFQLMAIAQFLSQPGRLLAQAAHCHCDDCADGFLRGCMDVPFLRQFCASVQECCGCVLDD